jgi:hypothetical protein
MGAIKTVFSSIVGCIPLHFMHPTIEISALKTTSYLIASLLLSIVLCLRIFSNVLV